MLSLVTDENFNHRILRGLRRVVPSLDSVAAQTAGLKGSPDPRLLDWAAEQGRVLVTHDVKTVPHHAYERIKAGLRMPGVVAVPKAMPIGRAIDDLQLLVECCQPSEMENLVIYLPL